MTDRTGRFGFIDGLRGIAALLVVLPHSNGLFVFPEANVVSHAMVAISPYGGRGVQLFFVISGFVISYSLRNADRHSFGLVNFILRRSIRLDPPYWCAIFAMWAAMDLQSVVAHRPLWTPPIGLIVSHLFYLQGILGYGQQINVVFWTLCIEFQLYVVYALFLMATERVASAETLNSKVRPAALIVFFVGSVVLAHTVWPNDVVDPWFVRYWYMFLAGVMLCWQMLGRFRRRQFLFCLAVMTAAYLWHPDSFKLSALLATIVIDQAVRRDKLQTWLNGRGAQLLGRLSYCIYLMHVPIALVVLGLRTRIAPKSNLVALLMLGLLYLLVLVASYVLHVAVEAPCLRLSARLKPKRAAT
jgi:peptidoglycan/LPS O-acetylase OafA/YrhL